MKLSLRLWLRLCGVCVMCGVCVCGWRGRTSGEYGVYHYDAISKRKCYSISYANNVIV